MRRLLICLLALLVIIAPIMIVRHYQTRETLSVPLLYRVVAVDPGHGGVDPGALGRDGMHEKDIVLKIGRAHV